MPALRARAGHFVEKANKKPPANAGGFLFGAWQARRSGGAVFAQQKKRRRGADQAVTGSLTVSAKRKPRPVRTDRGFRLAPGSAGEAPLRFSRSERSEGGVAVARDLRRSLPTIPPEKKENPHRLPQWGF